MYEKRSSFQLPFLSALDCIGNVVLLEFQVVVRFSNLREKGIYLAHVTTDACRDGFLTIRYMERTLEVLVPIAYGIDIHDDPKGAVVVERFGNDAESRLFRTVRENVRFQSTHLAQEHQGF